MTLPKLPSEGREAYLLPGLSHRSLISIGKLYDALFEALFDKQTVNITRKGCSTLQVFKYHQTGRWRLPLHNKISNKQDPHVEPNKQANNVVQASNLPYIIKYLHAAAFIPIRGSQ